MVFLVLLAINLLTLPLWWLNPGRMGDLRRFVLPVPPAVLAVTLLVYVASEDDYTDTGRSRWEVYEAQGITVAAIASTLVTALLGWSVGRSSARGRGDVVVRGLVGAVASLLSLVLVVFALANMTN